MNIRELQIGDWVYLGEKARYPMQIISVLGNINSSEGGVFLDFEGNEGDIWDADVKNIVPIPITGELLERNGFEKVGSNMCVDYEVEAIWEREIKDGQLVALEKYPDEEEMVFGCDSCLWQGVNIKYVHQLQNAMRMVGIEWEVNL